MADRKNSFGRGKNETNIVWASAFQGDSRKTFTGPRRWGEGPKRRGTAKVIAHRRHSQAHPRISLWLMRATFLRSVVPAHAGTHNPGHSLLDEGDCRFAKTKARGVWVPACAGTTMNDGLRRSQPLQHIAELMQATSPPHPSHTASASHTSCCASGAGPRALGRVRVPCR